MGTLEYEFINDPINADRTADELGFSIRWILEDKMVPIEHRKLFAANTTSELDTVSSRQKSPISAAQFAATTCTQYREIIMQAYCGNVIHVGLLDHCGHGALHRAVFELVIGVLIPYSL